MDSESPYMLLVAPVRRERRKSMTKDEEGLFGIEKLNVPKSDIPAVTHVDYSARVQTIEKDIHPQFRQLVEGFKEKTGYGVVVNTSFNVRGEPIVCTPEDAYLCFMRTEMDALVLENCVLHKEQQPALKDDVNWRDQFELD
jgi:carbamoyltransferase